MKFYTTITTPDYFFTRIKNTCYIQGDLKDPQYREQLDCGNFDLDIRSNKYKILNEKYESAGFNKQKKIMYPMKVIILLVMTTKN